MRAPAAQVHRLWRDAIDEALAALVRDASAISCVPVDVLLGPTRHEATVRVRAAIVWAARATLRASYPDIGRTMARDHSSVLSLVRRADRWAAQDPDFRRLCTRLARARKAPA